MWMTKLLGLKPQAALLQCQLSATTPSNIIFKALSIIPELSAEQIFKNLVANLVHAQPLTKIGGG
jgi:hypothetical protein